MENGVLGKKVFFLYPPTVLMEVVEELARQEFEVYLSRQHEKLRRVLPTLPGAISFVNLDDRLGEAGWRSYMLSLRAEVPAAGIGIITLNEDDVLREFYLMNLRVQCGFVIFKVRATRTAEILARTLEANAARDRRKFVAMFVPGSLDEARREKLRSLVSRINQAAMDIVFERA